MLVLFQRTLKLQLNGVWSEWADCRTTHTANRNGIVPITTPLLQIPCGDSCINNLLHTYVSAHYVI